MNFGEQIRELREGKELLQRQLAASLEIDTPMFSKIERGDRRAKRDQVILLAKLLNTDVSQLISIWLADQIVDLLKEESVALKALQLAEKQLKQIQSNN